MRDWNEMWSLVKSQSVPQTRRVNTLGNTRGENECWYTGIFSLQSTMSLANAKNSLRTKMRIKGLVFGENYKPKLLFSLQQIRMVIFRN